MLFLLAALTPTALAEDTVDLGVLRNSEVRVVQKQTYSTDKKLQIGANLGVVMDGFTVAPQLTLEGAYHLSETLGVEVQLGGGYGFANAFTSLVQGPEYGMAPEAYRYLASADLDVQWSPVYAKMNFGGKKVLHFDVYALLGVGAILEQSILPEANITVAPNVPVGLGARVWLKSNMALRAEVRDHICYETFVQTGTAGVIQKPQINLGLSIFTGGKK